MHWRALIDDVNLFRSTSRSDRSSVISMRMCTMLSLVRSNVFASSSQSIFVSRRKKNLASTLRIVSRSRSISTRRRRLFSIRNLKWRWRTRRRKSRRERKKKKKKKKKWKRRIQWWWRKKRRRNSNRANRCQQAVSSSNFCHHRQAIVFSSYRQKVDNFVNKLRTDCFFCSFDVSLQSIIKNLVKKSLKRMHREILV